MITLQELLNTLALSNPNTNQTLILFVVLNEQTYSIQIDNNNLRNSNASDIIRQAFPTCLYILDADTSIESISKSQIHTTTIAKVNINVPFIIPYTHFNRIINGTNIKSTNELNTINKANEVDAYCIAGILFSYFRNNQIEEFNSTWESMYTNWKRFGVKKI